MTAQILSGAYFCFALVLALAGAFFVEAFRHRRRDVSHLIFGVASFALAIYAAAASALYWATAFEGVMPLRIASRVVAGAAIVSVFLILHFALRYTDHPRERDVLIVSYPAMAVFVGSLVVDPDWVRLPTEPVPVRAVAGVQSPIFHVALSPLGVAFSVVAVVVMGGVIALIARAHLLGRAEGPAPLLGSALLAVAAVNDALGIGLALFDTVMLVPLGFVLFVWGMSVTLVDRYVRFADRLTERSDELAQRTAELTRSLEELELTQQEVLQREQLAVVGELAAVITHEVRNPMTIVQNAVSGLRTGTRPSEDTRGLLGIIEDEMGRLNSLVSKLLVLARPVVPQRTPWNLRSAIDDALDRVDELHESETAGRLEVQVRLDEDCPELSVDHELMRQVLVNLIDNAVEAVHDAGQIRILVSAVELDGRPALEIAVQDTGEGMTPQQVSQAVAPFFTTRDWGTGLGLSLCDRIVEAHGGSLAVESTRGEGTTVTVVLPDRDEGSDSSRRGMR